MKINELLSKKSIDLNVSVSSKAEAIDHLVNLMNKAGNLNDKEGYKQGVIPFAASDPLRVIPACIVGSAVAGGLSTLFGCTLRAPHGGIFVLPTIGNPLGYAAAIVAGAVVGCLILAVLKKPLKEAE